MNPDYIFFPLGIPASFDICVPAILNRAGTGPLLGEEAMEEELKNAKIIVADPLYRTICPKDSTFYEIPHVAFSGRMFI